MTSQNHTELSTAINLCCHFGVPFAAWSLPGETQIHFFSDPADGTAEAPLDKSFLINKFNTSSSDNIRIQLRCDLDATVQHLDTLHAVASRKFINNLPLTTAYDTYTNKVSRLIDTLKQMEDAKTVIARTISGKSQSFDLASSLLALTKKHPNAFCYVFFHPATGCWIGATPELLLHTNRNSSIFSTMALAGTMAANASTEWSEKNIREQQIVQSYVKQALKAANAKDVVESTRTVHYGVISHICTDYKGRLPFCDTFILADLLNPTPAVCGTPKDFALSMISEVEDFSRDCYAGYIAIETADSVTAMVNIRCAQIDPSSGNYCIYVGSGITADSSAADEWDETAMKAATLIDVLR